MSQFAGMQRGKTEAMLDLAVLRASQGAKVLYASAAGYFEVRFANGRAVFIDRDTGIVHLDRPRAVECRQNPAESP